MSYQAHEATNTIIVNTHNSQTNKISATAGMANHG